MRARESRAISRPVTPIRPSGLTFLSVFRGSDKTAVVAFWHIRDGRFAPFFESGRMDNLGRAVPAKDPISDQEQKRVALGYLQEAWAEARLDGIDGDCLAQASLFLTLAELVATYGEDAAAEFAGRLAARIKNGEFSLDRPRQ